eukprot:Nitzschia sp. Nitz4//scaffold217_size45653//6293//7489//NITZ4_007218-RA/size45653-processed-gene-0.24-mRNA-1//-1//CDS//3329542219//5186//frame0
MTDNSGAKNQLLVLSYATIGGIWGLSQVVLIPYVIHLLVLVTAILYVACHQSLHLLQEPPKGEEGEATDKETLRASDAYQFPIVGSLSLFSLYLAVKYLGPEWVNLLIGGYFGLVGCVAIAVTSQPLVHSAVTDKSSLKEYSPATQIPALKPVLAFLEVPEDVKFTLLDIGVFVLSALIVVAYFALGRFWALNNVLGICFCLQGIERLSLGTFKIGAILLIGLFFYDIFWVFGTDVMVTVAKNLNGPIKLLFPRQSLLPLEKTGKMDLSLLGLGDIVIPGFFLSLMLRFDAHRANIPTDTINIHHPFPKPYFHTTLIAYVFGLATTLFVMIQFHAAQPALLYLVPACLGSSFLCAASRGEVKELLAYSEEEEEEPEKEAVTEPTKGDSDKPLEVKKEE